MLIPVDQCVFLQKDRIILILTNYICNALSGTILASFSIKLLREQYSSCPIDFFNANFANLANYTNKNN